MRTKLWGAVAATLVASGVGVRALGAPPKGDCDCACAPRVSVRWSPRYSDSEVKSLHEAGVHVQRDSVPALSELICALDAGKDVRIAAEHYRPRELASLGGRSGRATAVVRSTRISGSDLRCMLQAGVDLELHQERSRYDLAQLVRAPVQGQLRVVVAPKTYSVYELQQLLEVSERISLALETEEFSVYELKQLVD